MTKRAVVHETYKSDKDGQYYFRLVTPEGKVLLRSEGYTRKGSRDKGLRSVMSNAGIAERIVRKSSRNGRFFFDVLAGNGKIVGTSVLFPGEEAREEAISLLAPGDSARETSGEASPEPRTGAAVTEDAIRLRAYEIYCSHRNPDNPVADWHDAVRELQAEVGG